MDSKTIMRLIQSQSEPSFLDNSRQVPMDDSVTAIYQLNDLKREKHESVYSYFSRFKVAARKADINKDDTLNIFFLQNSNSSRMVKYVNQAIALQMSLSSFDSFRPAVNLETFVNLARAFDQSEEIQRQAKNLRGSKSSFLSVQSNKSVRSLETEVNVSSFNRNDNQIRNGKNWNNYKQNRGYNQNNSYSNYHGSYNNHTSSYNNVQGNRQVQGTIKTTRKSKMRIRRVAN